MAGTTSKTTAAYVFEKRNRSPVPVMMISLILFFYRDPGFKVRKFFPAVDKLPVGCNIAPIQSLRLNRSTGR